MKYIIFLLLVSCNKDNKHYYYECTNINAKISYYNIIRYSEKIKLDNNKDCVELTKELFVEEIKNKDI